MLKWLFGETPTPPPRELSHDEALAICSSVCDIVRELGEDGMYRDESSGIAMAQGDRYLNSLLACTILFRGEEVFRVRDEHGEPFKVMTFASSAESMGDFRFRQMAQGVI